MSETHEPFFIVGAARSGTTMLRLMLNSHPELVIPGESYFLVPLMNELPLDSRLSKSQVETAENIIIKSPRFATWRTTCESLSASFSELTKPTLAELVDVVFRLETAHTKKLRWGDKTPSYATCIDKIRILFPSAKFIHIIRDGRDVSLSLKNVKWYGWTEFERAQFWSQTVHHAERSGAAMGNSNYLRLRYEDLVLKPEESLSRLCMFLDVSFDQGMLSFYEDAFHHLTQSAKDTGIHNKLIRPPRKTDVGRWRRESSLVHLLMFEAIAGQTMDQIGMERRFQGAGRCLTMLIKVLYFPIGITVHTIHQLFHKLPQGIQSCLRHNWLLRMVKGVMIRW